MHVSTYSLATFSIKNTRIFVNKNLKGAMDLHERLTHCVDSQFRSSRIYVERQLQFSVENLHSTIDIPRVNRLRAHLLCVFVTLGMWVLMYLLCLYFFFSLLYFLFRIFFSITIIIRRRGKQSLFTQLSTRRTLEH